MNKENFTQRFVSNPSCRTTVLPRSASVQWPIFSGLYTLIYNLLEMLQSKNNTNLLV